MLQLNLAQQISEAECRVAVNEYYRYLHGDTSACAVLYSTYLLNRQWRLALRCLDDMERMVGGDPFLGTMRTQLLLARGDIASARRESERTVSRAPYLIHGYFAQIEVSLAERNFDEVVELFNILQYEFGVELNDPATLPVYAEFVQSPQYDEWLRRQRLASRQQDPAI